MSRASRLVANAAAAAFAAWTVAATIGVTVGLTLAVAGADAAEDSCAIGGGPGGGTQQVAGRELTAEQMNNAHTVVSAAVNRRLPKQAAIIAVTAALTESELRNLDDGDRDSLGILQQRPSQGWGSRNQIRSPAYAANIFYDHLVDIPAWRSMPVGDAAQAVQGSAFPERYAGDEATARVVVDKFWSGPANPAVLPPDGTPAQATAHTGCDDQGGANTPLDRRKLPDDFTLPRDPRQRDAVRFALAQLGKPYVWGAKGPDAFDCSGLTQAAWAHAGVTISAGTINQVHDGTAVSGIDTAQPGDLLFIPGSLGTASTPRHIGIYVGHGLLVNAYDEKTGVVLESLNAWTDKIVAIRRPSGRP